MNKITLEKLSQMEEDLRVGLQGFICPKSKRPVRFKFCWSKCASHCAPLPVLLALAHQWRGSKPWVYHVTEIFNPPQQVWLQRNKPWYVPPDSQIDMNVGTAWHEKLEETKKYVHELGLQEDYIIEKNFKRPFVFPISEQEENFKFIPKQQEVTLSGTPDLYIHSTDTLWDYKIVKYFYTLKYMLEGKWEDNAYMWQLNTYRYLWYPQAEEMKLYCYVKDWKYNFPQLHGIQHTETVKVPKIEDFVMERRIEECLKEHVEAQLTGKYRECTEGEMWNNRIRCEYYCSVSRICPQYLKFLAREQISGKKRTVKKGRKK